MPNRATAPVGAPCWIDLNTSDPDRSRAFYGELFGWTANEPAEQFGGYFTFARDGVEVAGCMAAQPGMGQADVWTTYFATDDVTKTLEATVAHGGQIRSGPMVVGDLGTLAVVADPGAVPFGLWQADQFAGFTVLGESAAPSWFELRSRVYDAAVAFYRDTLRWDIHVMADTAQFRYTTARDPGGNGWLAGIADGAGEPADAPTAWSVYIGVDDADAALDTIVRLGGAALGEAVDSPYGRFAAVADPAGARFTLVGLDQATPVG